MLDWSAAKKKIGWQPLLTLDAGLKMTVDWYQEFYRKASSDQLLSLTLRQIEVVTKSDLPLNIIKEKAS